MKKIILLVLLGLILVTNVQAQEKYQYKITAYNVNAQNIIITIAFKRNVDISEIGTENIVYSAGTSFEAIIADIESKIKGKIDTFENDILAKDLIGQYKEWTSPVEKELYE